MLYNSMLHFAMFSKIRTDFPTIKGSRFFKFKFASKMPPTYQQSEFEYLKKIFAKKKFDIYL